MDGLLLAALDRSSNLRLAAYRDALEQVHGLDGLAVVAAQLYEDDLASGHMTVVSQMIAGSLARPKLAPEVLSRIEPWFALAADALKRAAGEAIPSNELAYGIVTFYVGLNLLSHLDADLERTRALFARVSEFASLADAVVPAREI